MRTLWNPDKASTWDAEHARVGAALQQDWAYGATMKMLGVGVQRVIVEQDGTPVALAQFILRFWGSMAAVVLCSRGPVWLADLDAADKRQAYRAIKQSLPLGGLKLHVVTTADLLGEEVGLSPLRRVMTGASTVMVDLQKPEEGLRADMEGSWRNQLQAAENADLKVTNMAANPGAYRWLLDAELKQREARGLEGLPAQFFDVYLQARKNAAQTTLGLRVDQGKTPAAGMIFLIHGKVATYQVGWSNEEARKQRANNLLLWRGMQALKARGIEWLDLGGINTQRSAGLARFKMGVGGQVQTMAGTYLF
jgi:hypothetical protein